MQKFKTADLTGQTEVGDSSPPTKESLRSKKLLYLRNAGAKRAGMLVFLGLLSLLFHPANASKPVLSRDPQLSSSSTVVSAISSLTLTLTRETQDSQGFAQPLWKTNQCWKLNIKNPYMGNNDGKFYSSFKPSEPPTCILKDATNLNLNGKVSCTVTSSETINFVFTELDATAASQKSIRVIIPNFQNPFSQRTLSQNMIQQYETADCSGTPVIKNTATLSVTSYELGSNDVTLSTDRGDTDGVVRPLEVAYGSTDDEQKNQLVIQFTPPTTLPPSKQGIILLFVPIWFVDNSNTQNFPFKIDNGSFAKNCYSTCFTVQTQKWVAAGQTVEITYRDMLDGCLIGNQITIKCPGFRNPIRPMVQTGYKVTTQDSNGNSIHYNNQVQLDASSYGPHVISKDSFVIQPTDKIINRSSEWQFTIEKIPFPLNLNCLVKLYIPIDLTVQIPLQSVQATEAFATSASWESLPYVSTTDYSYQTESDGRTSITIKSCKVQNVLSLSPNGSFGISNLTTPPYKKKTGEFGFQIFAGNTDDKSSLVAELEKGSVVSAAIMNPGKITNMEITPYPNAKVQANTGYIIKFLPATILQETSQVEIGMPVNLKMPPVNSKITVTSRDKITTATEGIMLDGHKIQISNILKGAQSIPTEPFAINFLIESPGFVNQNAAQDAGAWTIDTYTVIQNEAYSVDQGLSDKSFVATVGNIEAVGEIQVTNAVTYGYNSLYTLTFKPSGTIEVGGTIILWVPPQVLLETNVDAMGSCKSGYKCAPDFSKNSITMTVTKELIGNQVATLVIGGVRNPRTMQDTMKFVIETFDSKGNQIDKGYNASTRMTEATSISVVNVVSGSDLNGAVTQFTFSISITTSVLREGDQIQMIFPSDIKPPTQDNVLTCKSQNDNSPQISCGVNKNVFTVTFIALKNGDKGTSGTFSWTLDGVRNPVSMKSSGLFTDIIIKDKSGFVALVYTGKMNPIKTTKSGTITKGKLEQANMQSLVWNTYSLNFTPKNPIPTGGSFRITWPSQIQISQNDPKNVCIVTTNKQYSSNCVFNEVGRTITVTKVFDETAGLDGFSAQVTINLYVQNPATNKIGSGFLIWTYADADMMYNIDVSEPDLLIPLLNCQFPCRTCLMTNPEKCNSCWQLSTDDIKEQYFTQVFESSGVCEPQCREGFTSNGDPTNVCVMCDSSCKTCQDFGQVGDRSQCNVCSATHPFRLDGTNTCVPQCPRGYYESVKGSICSPCKKPCSACIDTADTCTACENAPVPFLFLPPDQQKRVCINQCPDGYTAVGFECVPCYEPCATCSKQTTFCNSCIPPFFQTYNGVCFPSCPRGTVEPPAGFECIMCATGCNKCDNKNPDICLECDPGLYVHEGKCTTACPKGFIINKEKTACQIPTPDDLRKIYFPFLLAALIAITICCFGKLKKKNPNQWNVSKTIEQKTITCIIVAISSLQFFAIIVQTIISFFFGRTRFGILTGIIFVLFVLLNFIFEGIYDQKFVKLDYNQAKKASLEKMRKENPAQYKIRIAKEKKEPVDDRFFAYKKKYGCVFFIISSMTALVTFKFNKLYYSQFFSFGMFKAQWTNTNDYRKYHTWFTIVHILVVDLALIVIGISGLVGMKVLQNQLWILFIETIVLSVADIGLCAFELFKLKEYLIYTAQVKKQGKSRRLISGLPDSEDSDNPASANANGRGGNGGHGGKGGKRKGLNQFYGELDEESRAEMIQGLLYRVQCNRNLFLNNKFDELLDMFGDRRCKSMIELGTGWDKEEDPRRTITIPMSPTLILEKYNGEYHFGLNDMYGELNDNCYADAMEKPTGIDQAIQGDQGQQDFNQALQRKQAEFLDPMQSEDELMNRKQKSGKRRGRKNKYYAQIDNEDDADAAEANDPSVNENSEDEENEAIILEQQREEEALRKKVEEERQKQEQLKAQRKAALAQAELARKKAEEQEELARAKAEQEEEALRAAQERLEMDRLRELDRIRLQMQQEEAQELERRNRMEAERKEELRKISEQNRLKYEAEEAKRQADLKVHQEKMAREAEEAEKRKNQLRAEQAARQRQEAERERQQKDEEDLKRRQEQLAAEEKMKNEAKEQERKRLEEQTLSRKQSAAELAKTKREEKELEALRSKQKLESDRLARAEAEKLQKEKDESERQRKLQEMEAERVKRVAMEQEFLARQKEEEEAFKKRKAAEEQAMKQSILEQAERDRQILMNEQETMRKQLQEQMDQERAKTQKEMETMRKKQEEEDRQRAIRIAEEEKARLAKIEADAKKREEEERKRESDRQARIKAEEEQIRKNKTELENEKNRLAQEKNKVLEQQASEEANRLLRQKQSQRELEDMQKAHQKELEKVRAESKGPLPKEAKTTFIQTEPPSRPQVIEASVQAFEGRSNDYNRGDKTSPRGGVGESFVRSERSMQTTGFEFKNPNLQEFRNASSDGISIPDADRRNFNVNDVLGDFERDDKGNVIVMQDKSGVEVDKQGRQTTIRGYLCNTQGDIVEGITGKKKVMFSNDDLDDRGELPAPFCVEKYNFDPHDLQGDLDFDFDQEMQQPIPRLLQTKQGFFVDKKGRRINKHGWLINPNSHICDKNGRIRFDRRQLEDGDLQRLYNYNGKRFDIKDVIGVFEKNKQTGQIEPITSKDGTYMEDNFGRRVNEKGYLVDREGNIVDKEGRKVWAAKDLKFSDFPKIFQFTKFNINNVMGDFEMSPLTDPILEKDGNGNFIDRRGRLVNARGYLIDKNGNIIDKYGKKMFDKVILSPDGELPKVFRINLLKSDSSSSLSELMREIEKNQPSDFEEGKNNANPNQPMRQGMIEGRDGDGETSVDSLMEDTPANYNMANQRFEENYDEYDPIPEETHGRESNDRRDRSKDRKQARVAQNQSENFGTLDMQRVKRKKKPKTKKLTKPQMLEYLMPTRREIDMAGAYGGNAKGQFRRPGVKYDKERLMNRIKTPANIPGGRAQLEALANTVAGFNAKKLPVQPIPDNLSARGSRPPMDRRNNFIDAHNRSEFHSNDGFQNLNNSVQYNRGDNMDVQKRSIDQVNRSRSNLPRQAKRKNQTGNFNEVDFEKVLGKDIDQFLEDSEWDIESYGKMSQFSRGGSARANSQDHHKIRNAAVEKVYMQRFEKEQESVGAGTAKNSHTTGPTTNAKRKYIPRDPERFNDSIPFQKGVSDFEGKPRDNSNSRSPPRAQPRNSFPEDRPKPIGSKK